MWSKISSFLACCVQTILDFVARVLLLMWILFTAGFLPILAVLIVSKFTFDFIEDHNPDGPFWKCFAALAALGVCSLISTKLLRGLARVYREIYDVISDIFTRTLIPNQVSETITQETHTDNSFASGSFLWRSIKICIMTSILWILAISSLYLVVLDAREVKSAIDYERLVGMLPTPSDSVTNNYIISRRALSRTEQDGEDGKILFLTHFGEGNPKSKDGIALESADFQSLERFKEALQQCSSGEVGLKLKLRGFSSESPVYIDGEISPKSNEWNCEIANLRTESVVKFLVGDEDGSMSCPSVEKQGVDPCEGRVIYRCGKSQGLAFDIEYDPWTNYEEMSESRIGMRGAGGVRVLASDLFNRVVQIEFDYNECFMQAIGLDN